MKRQPRRLPRARHSSSSAEVWWISSAISVSRGGSDAGGLPRAGAGDDADPYAPACQARDLLTMLALEHGVDVELKRQLDGLAGGAGGGDDDDPAGSRLGAAEGVAIRREEVIADTRLAHG